MNRIFKQIKEGLSDLVLVWYDEFKEALSDTALILLFFIAPLFYPIVYGLIYANEVATEAKLVVVDLDNSKESREFRRLCDATHEIDVVGVCANMEEAKEVVNRREAFGILLFPRDFSKRIAQKDQATLQLYCEMSSLLYYKNLLAPITEISLETNKEIQVDRLDINSVKSAGTESLSTTYINYQNASLFNPQNGFNSFLLPAFVMLLIQQTMVIGICVLSGGVFDRKRFHTMYPILRHKRGTFRIVIGKVLFYLTIYLINAYYLLHLVPKIFNLPQIGDPVDIITLILPYIVACSLFGMTLSVFVKEKETAYVLLTFFSLIFLFISGVSWPQAAIPTFWKYVSYIIPSTFGIQGFVKINTMGATIPDISFEFTGLLIQIVVYFITACLVYRYRIIKECV